MTTQATVLNFTNRRRIEWEDIKITLRQREGDPCPLITGCTIIGLQSKYQLDDDARVYVEANRFGSTHRFDCGCVKRLHDISNSTLSRFQGIDRVTFDVKVVEACSESNGSSSRIIAFAERVKPELDPQSRQGSFLGVEWDEHLHHEYWRLDIDDIDGPRIRLSKSLVKDRAGFTTSNHFVALVLPGLIRDCMTWAVNKARRGSIQIGSPEHDWLSLGLSLTGHRKVPSNVLAASQHEDGAKDWIEQIVERFSRRHNLTKLLLEQSGT